MSDRHHLVVPGLALLLSHCTPQAGQRGGGEEQGNDAQSRTTAMDSHSAARPQEAVITQLQLDIAVDMQAHRITGTASYALAPGHGARVVMDTDGLRIDSVTDGGGRSLPYELGEAGPFGAALEVELADQVDTIRIAYTTGPGARALQWIRPR